MKKFALILPAIALLAACGEEPAAEPEAVAAPEPVVELPAPDEAKFTEVFAATCEGAEPVSTAICKSALGSETVTCEFGLGEDEYMRHEAPLMKNEEGTDWVLGNAEAICTEHGAHHVDS